jgi:hypothetical protein
MVSDPSPLLMLESYCRITNISSNAIAIKASRNLVVPIIGSSNYFCWDYCYDSSTSVSDGSVTILPGDTNSSFSAHYKPMGNEGTCVIKYCFFNPSDILDSICYNANYVSGTVGLEIPEERFTKPRLFPSPSSGKLFINLLGESKELLKLQIFNSMGSLVYQRNFENQSKVIDITPEHLPPGLYYYSLYSSKNLDSFGKIEITY